MITYRDFETVKAGWITYYDATGEALTEVNDWITTEGIDVINVETIVSVAHGHSSSSFIRVWYRYDEQAEAEQSSDPDSFDPNT